MLFPLLFHQQQKDGKDYVDSQKKIMSWVNFMIRACVPVCFLSITIINGTMSLSIKPLIINIWLLRVKRQSG